MSVVFEVTEFDYSKVTDAEQQEIRSVYEYAFTNDIGLQFDASLDADFTNPSAYYTENVRGAYFVVRNRTSGIIVGTAGIRNVAIPETCLGFSAAERATGVCELKRMFILPEGRGRGLGVTLLRVALNKAKMLGFAVVVLDTQRKLEAANACYEKNGFVDCNSYNGNPRADRFMALRL